MTSSRQLLGFRFDHQHGVLGAGHDEIELAVGATVDGEVEDVFAIDVADAGGADRAHEGDARNGQRGGGGDHGEDVRVVLHVVLENGDDDLRLVLVAIGEQRADRAVDEARGQRLVLGRTAFALEVAARDLAGGEVFFLVVDGQREEVAGPAWRSWPMTTVASSTVSPRVASTAPSAWRAILPVSRVSGWPPQLSSTLW